MRRVPLLVLSLLLVPLANGRAQAGDADETARATIEVVGPSRPLYVHERFRLVLRVTIDRDFFEKNAVPLFRQRLDVPIQAEAPWAGKLQGARVLVPEPGATARADGDLRRLSLNGDVARARLVGTREVEGRSFSVLEIERRYVAEVPGRIHVARPSLLYAYATRFQEDFAGDRIALDRRDVTVEGAPLELDVLPLPVAGRPKGFVDAVGSLRLSASIAGGSGDGGREPLALRLEISGDGDLETLTPPTVDAIEGFHVFGVSDRMEDGVRVVTYEIASESGATHVPPIELATFDPGPPARYAVLQSDPLSLPGVVAPSRTPSSAGSSGPAARSPRDAGRPGLAALALALLVLVGLGVVAARKRRGRAAVLRAAAAPARVPVAPASDDPVDGLAAALASRLGVSPTAVIAPDLASRLVRADVDPRLAAEAAALLEALVGARYGGQPVPDAATRVAALAACLARGDGPTRT